MVEANPFAGERTLAVLESDPPERPMWDGIRAIRFDVDRANPLAPPKPRLDAIDAMLATVPDPEQIELVAFDYDSLLTALPRIDRFANLRFAHIAARGIKSYDRLYGLRKLDGLFLVAYRRPDLSDFASLDLELFRAIRGQLERFDVAARHVHLQSCARLTDVAGARVRTLVLEACNRTRLEQLPAVEGLRDLQLRAHRHIPTLDWLADCASLRALVINASSLGKTDVSALCKSTHIRCAFLGSTPRAVIAKIAEQAPAMVVTNGDVTFWNGGPAPLGKYYEVAGEVAQSDT